MTINYRLWDWEWRTEPCTDDKGSMCVNVLHPTSGRWEFADYVLTDAMPEEIEEVVRNHADRQLD